MIYTQRWSLIVSQLQPIFARPCEMLKPIAVTTGEIETVVEGVALKNTALSEPIWITGTDNSLSSQLASKRGFGFPFSLMFFVIFLGIYNSSRSILATFPLVTVSISRVVPIWPDRVFHAFTRTTCYLENANICMTLSVET